MSGLLVEDAKHGFGAPSVLTPGSTCPPSFKSVKSRKNKEFIASESSRPRRETSNSFPDVDPDLLDADSQQVIRKVAALIRGYLLDVKSMQGFVCSPEHDPFLERNAILHAPDSTSSLPCSSCLPCFSWLGSHETRKQDVVPREVPSDRIEKFLLDVSQGLDFCKQVIVLAAMYIERFLGQRRTIDEGYVLTPENWRCICSVALLTASKVWEDVHPWNADFQDCLLEVQGLRYRPGAFNRHESKFLELLEWRVHIYGEDYAAYFFSILEDAHSAAPETLSPSKSRSQKMTRTITEPLKMQPIQEDEPWFPDVSLGPGSFEEFIEPNVHLPASPCTMAELREAWSLDARNPYVGSLRHALPALSPSKYIQNSQGFLWQHELAKCSSGLLGPACFGRRTTAPATISGSTGASMAAELRKLVGPGGQPAAAAPKAAATAAASLLSDLFAE